MKKSVIFSQITIGLVILFMAGCASVPDKDRAALEAQERADAIAQSAAVGKKYTVIDDPTTAFEDINPPAWIVQYIGSGNLAVEKLPDYARYHCFVIEYEGDNKDMAVSWVRLQANAAQQVAELISTTVSADATSKLTGADGEEVKRNLKQAIESMSNASFTGLSYNSNFWQELKNNETGETVFRAYGLWIVDRKSLDNQIAANLQNIVDNNKSMSMAERAIYNDLIAGIRGAAGFQNSFYTGENS